jgi:ubiquinone/menaquinone biosynthesis C-methylase UbiE
MHEKRFDGAVERLRAPERLARLEAPRVVDLALAGITAEEVLDVGVGSGVFAEAFAQRGLTIAGVDVNPAMIAAAQTFVPGGDFRLAPAEALPFPAATFDLVFLGLLLHESDDPRQVLQEAQRVGRQRVAILEWIYQEQDFGPPLAHRIAPATIQDLARQVGFTVFEIIPLTQLLLYRLTV